MKKSTSSSASDAPASSRPRWCLVGGFAGILLWLLGGLALEGLHGFKAASYLDDPVRRETWTLAHAHGTLLSILCVVAWLAAPSLVLSPRALRWADRLLASGAVLVPLGFLLGGVSHSEADPGLGILLVPAGALLAAAGVALALRGALRRAA